MSDTPVQLGEPIPSTQLIRRWQRRQEIAPLYRPEPCEANVVSRACEAAAGAGYRSVNVWGLTYVSFSGQWYVWG